MSLTGPINLLQHFWSILNCTKMMPLQVNSNSVKFQLTIYGKTNCSARGNKVILCLIMRGVKKDQVLAKVQTVHASIGQCYYLRLLLHEINGPISFTALKAMGGVIHRIFQAACRENGLLADDAHRKHTLEEDS